MTDKITETKTEAPEPKPEPTSAVTEKSDSGKQEHMIPKGRFDEVNNELKQLRADMAKAQTEREKAEAAALAEQGKFKELYESANTELESVRGYQEKYEAILTGIKETNEKRIADIPENMRSLVPDIDDPIKMQSWLDANSEHFKKKPTAPDLNGGTATTKQNGEQAPSATQIREEAARLQVNPEHYAQSRYGVSLPKQ